MSLTIFVHESLPITAVRWLRESRGLVDYACGPLIQISLEEFRVTGHSLVLSHFEEYSKIRLEYDKIVKPFGPGEAEKLMKNRRAVELLTHPDKNLIFSPLIIGKFSLGDLQRVKPLVERIIPLNSPSKDFWETFDLALADAPLRE